MSKKEIAGIVVRIVTALTLLTVAIVFYDDLTGIDITRLISSSSISVTIAIVFAVYIVKALVFVVPASVVYVAVGAVLPPVLAVAVNLAGIFTEVSVTFFLGRFLGKDAVHKLLSRNAGGRKILEKNLQDKASALIAIRAIPAFPIDFISLFYGASGCGYLKYAFLSVAGVSWRVILFTILGDAFFEWIPTDKIIFVTLCLIPVFIIFSLIKKYVIAPEKAKKAAEKAAAEERVN